MKKLMQLTMALVVVLMFSSNTLAMVGAEPPEEGMLGITMVGAPEPTTDVAAITTIKAPEPGEHEMVITRTDGDLTTEGPNGTEPVGTVNNDPDKIRYLGGQPAQDRELVNLNLLLPTVVLAALALAFVLKRKIVTA